MRHITSLTANSPKRKGRMESVHWYALFVMLLVAAVFLLLGFMDAYSVRKQKALFNDRQYLQTTTVRLVVEDRVSAARTRMRFLLDSLFIDARSSARIDEVQRSLQSAIYNSPDILGFAFIPHPLREDASPFRSFRSTPAGDSAREFVRSLEERFDFSSPRPRDLYPFSGTVRASSRNSMMAVVEPFAEEGRFAGYFISILDLGPLLARYIHPMSRGRGSVSFLIGSDGTVVDHKERSLIGRNAATLSDGEGALVREAWNAMGRSLSGMESLPAPPSASDGERRLLAWNSARTGAERLFVGLYSSESEINPALDELRMQRNLLGGGLVLVILMGTAFFLRRKESSELRRSEAVFRSIFNSAAAGIAILDANGAILSCNTTLESMTGRSSTNLAFFTLFDLVAPSSPEEKEKVRSALREGVRSARAELLFSRKGVEETRAGNRESLSDEQSFWGDVSLNRLEEAVGEAPGRMLAVVTDISGRKRAEELLRQNAGLLESRKEELEELASGQSALLRMFTFFSECGTTEELFEVLKEHLLPVIPFRSLTLFLKRSREARSFNVLDSSGDVLRSGQTRFLDERRGVMGHVAETGTAYLIGDVATDPYFIPHSREIGSVVVAPVIYKGFLWGAIVLDSREKFAFGIRERDILSLVGLYVALHLEEFSARRELDRKATQLGFLHGMIQQIAAERHNEEMVRKVVDVLVSELDFPRVEFFTPVPGDSEGVALLAGRSLHDAAEDVPEECGPEVAAAMRTGTPVVREGVSSAHGEAGRVTVLALPIVFEEEIFGVLGACSEGFSPAEREVLEITAEHMTTFWALNNLLALRRHESLVDPLTQVWNRRYIMRRLDEENSRILRHQGHGAVVLVDLGDFKLINDRHGHVMGDEVLRITSATMSGNLRSYDMIGRYGGDEFLLYLPDVPRDEAEAIMSRMERKVAEQEIPGLHSAVILDYGIAVCPDDGDDLAEVIKTADERMYRNKARRKAAVP